MKSKISNLGEVEPGVLQISYIRKRGFTVVDSSGDGGSAAGNIPPFLVPEGRVWILEEASFIFAGGSKTGFISMVVRRPIPGTTALLQGPLLWPITVITANQVAYWPFIIFEPEVTNIPMAQQTVARGPVILESGESVELSIAAGNPGTNWEYTLSYVEVNISDVNRAVLAYWRTKNNG